MKKEAVCEMKLCGKNAIFACENRQTQEPAARQIVYRAIQKKLERR